MDEEGYSTQPVVEPPTGAPKENGTREGQVGLHSTYFWEEDIPRYRWHTGSNQAAEGWMSERDYLNMFASEAIAKNPGRYDFEYYDNVRQGGGVVAYKTDRFAIKFNNPSVAQSPQVQLFRNQFDKLQLQSLISQAPASGRIYHVDDPLTDGTVFAIGKLLYQGGKFLVKKGDNALGILLKRGGTGSLIGNYSADKLDDILREVIELGKNSCNPNDCAPTAISVANVLTGKAPLAAAEFASSATGKRGEYGMSMLKQAFGKPDMTWKHTQATRKMLLSKGTGEVGEYSTETVFRDILEFAQEGQVITVGTGGGKFNGHAFNLIKEGGTFRLIDAQNKISAKGFDELMLYINRATRAHSPKNSAGGFELGSSFNVWFNR